MAKSAKSDPQLVPAVTPPIGGASVGVSVAAPVTGSSAVVTARAAGGLRDLKMEVSPAKVGVDAALQHMAKAMNVAFQSDFAENHLECVYQAAVVRHGEIKIYHREYFGFSESWFGQFGRLLRSMSLTFQGPDPASPEGQRRIAESGTSSIRGLLSLVGRKMDLVPEYEDRVPALVQQTLDRLEASAIIVGWNRDDWVIETTRVGLDIRIRPADKYKPKKA